MQQKLERLIKFVYKKWRLEQPAPQDAHPDEEAIVCLIEGHLSQEENDRIIDHLLACDRCSESLALNLELSAAQLQEVPQDLLNRLKDSVPAEKGPSILEVVLRLKEKALELINTSGDVLLGQELVPAPLLRSRQIKDFKDELIILKDFKEIRVEVRIEKKAQESVNLFITVKQKQTQKPVKDLRVTLIKDEIELESYLSDSGTVKFEHVLSGAYTVDISSVENKLASVSLDIKV